MLPFYITIFYFLCITRLPEGFDKRVQGVSDAFLNICILLSSLIVTFLVTKAIEIRQEKSGRITKVRDLSRQISAANEELRLQTTKDLEQVYKEKMELINGQLASEQKLQNERIGILNDQIKNYKSQISELGNKTAVNWTIVIIAIIFGLILGYLLKRN